jgi:integrator complex subunit 11
MLNNGPAYDFLTRIQWYADPRNLIVFPGYCGERTLGRAILERGSDNRVVWDAPDGRKVDIVIRCKIERISFSAHADQFEILTMCERLRPREVVTVHGDRDAVATLAARISEHLGIRSHVPELEQRIVYEPKEMMPIEIDQACVRGTSFEGAVTIEGSILKVVPIEKAAAETGSGVSTLALKRRIKRTATFDEIVAVLTGLHLIDGNEAAREGEPLHTNQFLCEFMEDGLLLTFDVSGKAAVNTFSCLLARFPIA